MMTEEEFLTIVEAIVVIADEVTEEELRKKVHRAAFLAVRQVARVYRPYADARKGAA